MPSLRLFVLFAAAVAVALAAEPVRAAEYHYLLVFGSQSMPVRPKYTHTWGTAVRVWGQGNDLRLYQVETHTISWMPATLDIRVLAAEPEAGINLDLAATLRVMHQQKQEATLFGPYQIDARLYSVLLAQKAYLESGQVRYKAVDPVGDETVSNCIHALTDIDARADRAYYTEFRALGAKAADVFARRLHERKLIVNPGADHGWLAVRLGVDREPVTRRRFSP